MPYGRKGQVVRNPGKGAEAEDRGREAQIEVTGPRVRNSHPEVARLPRLRVRTGRLYWVFFTWFGGERLGRAKSGVAALFCEICSTRGAGSHTRAAIALPARRWSHVTSEHICSTCEEVGHLLGSDRWSISTMVKSFACVKALGTRDLRDRSRSACAVGLA